MQEGLKKYLVSRTFATRMTWEVEAASAEAALEMMDDQDLTPTDEADEDWLGPINGLCLTDQEDKIEVVE